MPMTDDIRAVVELYRQNLRGCQTENQVNWVHIAFDNHLAPAELRGLAAALAADPPDSLGRRWSAAAVASLPVNRVRPVEFRRIGIHDGLSVYTAGAGRARDKTLVIGFSGRAQRMMVPTAALLDCFNPALYDVVILRDPARLMFVRGIPGLGGTFFEILSNLGRHVDLPAYRNVIPLGTSAGGLPAILAAQALDLATGICVSGQEFGVFVECAASAGVSEEPFRQLLAARSGRPRRLVLACAADNDKDRAATEDLAARVPARVVTVRNCATHGVLGHLARQKRLPAFLAKMLDQSLEGGWPVVRNTAFVRALPVSAFRDVRVDAADLTPFPHAGTATAASRRMDDGNGSG